jgi:hypothetical protein
MSSSYTPPLRGARRRRMCAPAIRLLVRATPRGRDATIIPMPEPPDENRGPIVPGARVRVRAGSGARSAWVSGVVVDDYAAEATAGGHKWAPVRRWAVATDDGTLVFVDDGAIVFAPPDESGD